MPSTNLINDLLAQFAANPRRVFARLANEYRKAGDFQSAIDICRTHVPLQPTYISGHIVLGQSLFESGQLDDARTSFETALALDPENLIALRHLGDIARGEGDTAAARGWYERLLDVDPQNEEAESYLATLEAAPPPEAPIAAPASEASAHAAAADVDLPFVDLSSLTTAPELEERDGAAAPREPAGTADAGAGERTSADIAPEVPWWQSVEHSHDEHAAVEPASARVEDPLLHVELSGTDAEPLGAAAPAPDAAADPRGWGDAASWGSVEHDPLDAHAPTGEAPESGGASDIREASGFDFTSLMYPDLALSSASEPPPLPPEASEWLGGDVELPREPMAAPPKESGEATEPVAAVPPAGSAPEAVAEPATTAEPPTAPEPVLAPEPVAMPERAMPDVRAVAPEAVAPAAHAAETPRRAPVATPAEGAATTFVTETMAELYIRQGHVAQAITVYQQLVERHPDDIALRGRLAELEAAPAAHGDPLDGRSVREFFARLFERHAPGGASSVASAPPPAPPAAVASDLAPPPAAEAAPEPPPLPASPATAAAPEPPPAAAPVGAEGFFSGAAVAAEDQQRAAAIAAAFPAVTGHGASGPPPPDAAEHEAFSLDHVFRQEGVYPPDVPASLPEVSFDEFFAEQPAPGAPPPAGTGTRASTPPPAADADLEMFQAWLEGLKK